MQRMMSLGIDLASQETNTAACSIEWLGDRAIVQSISMGLSDSQLDVMIAGADVVGIDAPFGWPAAFAAGVAQWDHEEWTDTLRDRWRFRVTDHHAKAHLGRWPLSVSSDLIALPAMRAMALLHRHGVTDRSGGDGRFFEVYPAASLHAWGLASRGYKGKKDDAPEKRREIFCGLGDRMPWFEGSEPCLADDNLLDALVAAITARQAAQGMTGWPDSSEKQIAVQEGWIHIPTTFPDRILFTAKP